jgi:hypothetical protein
MDIMWNGRILPTETTSDDDAILPPPGAYRVRISALRPFGKKENGKDYQVWNSPRFLVQRNDTSKPSTVVEKTAPAAPAAVVQLERQAARHTNLQSLQDNSVLPLLSWTARDTQ